ncbi:hypothetical protein [Chenggangzhangella methanolivorans]|uniref:Uncharacterized protein n=1 Tax=Chenggangzhangella methanolivorans TaxID=1437009 RepID=A0A9E6RD46_9HYPH|nr:hypothetical protein [Chenggangzhangella methanolivorans]QZN98850.1 hypothetical protein K6K41_18225 [Chenggangzhangella methanolivorans]
MAKAQKRGNKEAKKPKKIKEPVAAPTASSRGVLATAAGSPKAKKS